ncbi:FAD dependent oxidoreductase [Multifurca ochricompacta]|uniref:FAD dependent oxidoreductase n=1 Tax=Multifurca ochricompacta TaxID=376703 RepID=A0AAD4MCL1_9AGAM|nr:FAD dependent oxidoreductase [Multifurca ochricompacta]
MGNLFSLIKLAITILRELGEEYRTVRERIKSSPGLPVNQPLPSFWMVPPVRLPTSTELPSFADVIVIGSGITGASCTRTLLRKGPSGLRVLVLEARDVCSGATGRNGGHINPPLFHDYAQLKSEFGIDSAKRIIRFRLAHLSALREAIEDIGALDYSQIRRVQKLDVHFDRDTFKEQKKAFEEWRVDMPEEAVGFYVVEGSEVAKEFQLSEQVVGVIACPGGAAHPYRIVTSIFANHLERYPNRFNLFTQTPCTGIIPPSTVTPYYTVQTPRGTITTRHVIHTTNGWVSHLLPGLRGKVFPLRGLMTAQRPGIGLPTQAGTRAHIFHYVPPGYDYLTQLPNQEGEGGGELLFGGGAVQGGRITLSEVGMADDSQYHLGIASHVQGALPEYFGRANWGAESAPAVDGAPSLEVGEKGPWHTGRVKALWTGILGVSADMQPWVGRVPSAISGRVVKLPLLAGVCEKGAERQKAAPGEWVSAGYSGEGMVHAWLCAHALALMVLGLEEEEGVCTWFPDEYRLTEKRWKNATLERLMDRL